MLQNHPPPSQGVFFEGAITYNNNKETLKEDPHIIFCPKILVHNPHVSSLKLPYKNLLPKRFPFRHKPPIPLTRKALFKAERSQMPISPFLFLHTNIWLIHQVRLFLKNYPSPKRNSLWTISSNMRQMRWLHKVLLIRVNHPPFGQIL